MENHKRNRRCVICGDTAVGYNFGAVSCESCKAFFRRTAPKSQLPSCLFDQECVITVATRRFCSYCRLLKCFKCGMKADMILDDKAKFERRTKIERNRQVRLRHHVVGSRAIDIQPRTTTDSFNEPTTTTSLNPPQLSLHLASREPEDQNDHDQQQHQPTRLHRSSFSPKLEHFAFVNGGSADCVTTQTLCDPLQFMPIMNDCSVTASASKSSSAQTHDGWLSSNVSLCDADLVQTFLSTGHGHQVDSFVSPICPNGRASLSTSSSYSPNSGEFTSEVRSSSDTTVNLPINVSLEKDSVLLHEIGNNDDTKRLLSHYQWSTVNDLRHAYETNFVTDDSCPNLNRPDLTLSSLINTSRFIVRRLINFAKTLSDFSQLKQDCQISLLRGVVLSTLFLLSARHYDVEKDVWMTPKGEVSTQILKVATGVDKFYQEHTKYCRDFNALVAQDSNLIALMQALCLFTPDRPSLDARQTVANIHDRYYLLLKHYLEAKVGFSSGRSMLAAILTNLGQLEGITANYGHMLMQVDPTKVDPLLMEIFNLTPSFKTQ